MHREIRTESRDIDWEEKYRALLLETARAEDQWREIEEILKRGVARLSLLVQDGNAVLDSMLEQLRASIREGGDLQMLGEHLLRIAALSGLPDHRPAADDGAERAHTEAADRLLLSMLEELKSHDLLTEVSYAKIRQRLYAGGNTNSEAGVVAVIVGEIRDYLDAQNAGRAADESKDHAANEVLPALLDALPVPDELEDEKQRIKRKLQHQPDAYDNAAILADLLALCTDARRVLQQQAIEIQNFLLGVNDRLQEIEQCLNNYAKRNAEAVTHTKTMGESVRFDLDEINRSLESETEIALLKQFVQSRLRAIEITISEGIDMQEKQSEKTEKEIKRLLNRLEQLESETQKLRVQVSQERARAHMDPLTKLYNRTALDEKLEQEINRSARYKASFSLILWDLDHFKNINDSYGRQAGDKVLQVVAKILQERQRVTDFSARYEGEKIVGVLPETNLAGARCLAEDLRKKIENSDFRYRGAKVRITVSAGVASYEAEDTAKTLLSRAGEALNQAKRNGRNQVATVEDQVPA